MRVEFYIDAKDQYLNKRAFDSLLSRRSDVETSFEGPLSWERLDDKRASRIAVYTPGTITSSPEDLNALAGWATDGLVRLYRALAGLTRKILPSGAVPLPDSFDRTYELV